MVFFPMVVQQNKSSFVIRVKLGSETRASDGPRVAVSRGLDEGQ